MKDEIDSLIVNKTWVFKTRRDERGKPIRWKARLVSKSFSQHEGIDYMETFSPVVRNDSIRYLLMLADMICYPPNERSKRIFKWYAEDKGSVISA